MPFELGLITFSLATLSLGILLIAQLRNWNSGKSSFVLVIATVISMLWSLGMLAQSWLGLSLFYLIPMIEALKNAVWFGLLLSILGLRDVVFGTGRVDRNRSGLMIVAVSTFSIPAILLLAIPVLRFTVNGVSVYAPDFGGQPVLLGFLMSSIAGLALLEQVVRNIRAYHSWHLKFLCLGLGMVFSYDLYMYSEATLFARIDPALWQIRGAVIALAAPMIGLGVVRTRQQPIQLNISRRLVFHTGVLVAAGLYLLLMAGAGFYIRNVSGEWGTLLRVLFWVISLTFLATLAFSGRMRSLLKFYISRNLFTSKYDYREEWMRISQTLSDTESDESLPDRAIHALAGIVDSPSGGLWLTRDGIHYEQVAQVELGWLDNAEVDRTDYLIRYLEETNQVIDLHAVDTLLDRRLLPEWLEQVKKAWLIVPLELQGRILGFVLLRESRVEFELIWEDYELFTAAGRQTASYLAQMVTSDALAEARQFTAFNQGSAFVVHDIKTLNSQLSMLVHNAKLHKSNPEFIDDMIKTTEHAVSKMDFLLKHFKKGDEAQQGGSNVVNLVDLIRQVVQSQSRQKPAPIMNCKETSVLVVANEDELKAGIGHIVQNAQDATPDSGVVEVSLATVGGIAELEIRDNGCGMTQEFIQTRLFRPFESTKGLTGMGIGVFQSREYLRKLGGNLTARSRQGEGTVFTLTIPLCESGSSEEVPD